MRELTAPFVAEYAASQLAPAFPHTEEILMILPDFALIMSGIAKWQQLYTEPTFTFMILSHSSLVIS